jgi:hypothetical protein
MSYDIAKIAKDYQSGGSKQVRPYKPSDRKGRYFDDKGNEQSNDPGSASWYKQQAEWLWWMFANNYTDFNYSTRQEMINLRQYAQGTQPIEKYIGSWRNWDKKNNRWMTWVNISFDIYAIIPHFVASIRGKFNKVDFTAQAHCVDETAGTEREEIIWKQSVLQQDKQFYDKAHAAIGSTPDQNQQQLPFIPQNKEQAQMLVDMGFVKLTSEAKLEELMKQSSDDGRWTETIKTRCEVDGFVLGRMASKVDVDPASKKIMPRYVDPENLIVRYRSQDEYYQKISYIGEVVPYTVGDLRVQGIKDEELRRCVLYYANTAGNPAVNFPNGSYFNPMWNDFATYVVDMEFEAVDLRNHKWIEFDQITGEWIPSSQDKPGAMPEQTDEPNISGDHTAMTQYPKWHRCKWVIGTNIVFDYGFQYNVPYSQDKRPESNYSVVRVADRSAISIVVTDADDIQNLVLKRRAAVAKMRPPGTIIDKNAWAETEIGGRKFTWLDQINMFNQTGDGVIQNPITPTGQAIPGVPLPFYENKGTIGVLADYDDAIDRAVGRMANKIGLGLPAEGSAPDPNAPVGTSQIALEGTNNVLRPILMAYQSLKKQTFNKIAYQFEIREKADLLKVYDGIIGGENIDLLKFMDMFHHGISVDALIDDDTRNDLLASMKLSLQAAKTGGVGITDADYFACKRLIDQGLYKSAELFLSWRDAVRKKEAQDLQTQNMQLNGQNMQMQEQAKQQTMLSKMAADKQTKLELQNAELQNQLLLMSQQLINDRTLLHDQSTASHADIAAEGLIDEALIGVQADADIKVGKALPKPKPTKK